MCVSVCVCVFMSVFVCYVYSSVLSMTLVLTAYIRMCVFLFASVVGQEATRLIWYSKMVAIWPTVPASLQ